MMHEETTPAENETIKRLTVLTPLEYDRVRITEAKTLNIRPATLDNLIKSAKLTSRKENKTPFTEIEPWHEPINPAELLTDISNTIKRFIICPPETIHAATLWIAMTWFKVCEAIIVFTQSS
jgi:putative DNA primase/helicase